MALPRYLDVVIRVAEKDREIHSRLMGCAHSVIKQQGLTLALAWPDMRHGSLGYVLRVFGEQAALDALLEKALPLFDEELIRAYPASDTPSTIKTIAYLRDRSAEKLTEGFHQRRIRRFAHLGDNHPQRKEGTHRFLHNVNIKSDSTQKHYNVHIRVHDKAPDNAGGNSYGLGFTLPNF